MGRTLLLILTILTITISILASSASARSLNEVASTSTPWLSLGLTAIFAIGLYILMNWGDKREPYKI
jgi:hypothetical protein